MIGVSNYCHLCMKPSVSHNLVVQYFNVTALVNKIQWNGAIKLRFLDKTQYSIPGDYKRL